MSGWCGTPLSHRALLPHSALMLTGPQPWTEQTIMELTGTAEAITALIQQVAALAQSVQDLQTSHAILHLREQHRAEATPHPPSTPLMAPTPEPDFAMPETFTGKKSAFRTFITACELLFALKPQTYPSDYIKVHSAIALLSGQYRTWTYQFVHNKSPQLESWESFTATIRTPYDDPVRPSAARTA
ncbi:Hypothetical predicted protein [Pelobates cultripes]|uniref:DUF4939 domain-containing protein n=1 Tax=Pelobates cultripes TaxID=61616 RepID=A0AAD1W3Z8_PELCU|nr:Hypothetical predicted protein [Pelobates cultripes]